MLNGSAGQYRCPHCSAINVVVAPVAGTSSRGGTRTVIAVFLGSGVVALLAGWWGLAIGVGLLAWAVAGALGKEPTKVIDIDKRSSAAQAGVKVGDVILALDGTAIASTTDLQRRTADYRWGDYAKLDIRRDGAPMTLTVPFRRPGR